MSGKISVELIKQLRERTGAGVMECKRALEETGGDLEKAEQILQARGAAVAEKRAGKVAKEGLIEAYIHGGGRFGALVEINCETDFVARTEEFKQLAHDIAVQVVGMNPKYVSREDIPEEEKQRQMEIFRKEAEAQGRPPEIVEKIVQGRMERWYSEVCLLDQPFFRDEKMTVRDRINEVMGKLGEKIVVRRFVRFKLGEEA